MLQSHQILCTKALAELKYAIPWDDQNVSTNRVITVHKGFDKLVTFRATRLHVHEITDLAQTTKDSGVIC